MKWLRRTLRVAAVLFAAIHVIAIFHAYRFTHFSEVSDERIRRPEEYTFSERAGALLFGAPNHRIPISSKPTMPYESLVLQGKPNLACWWIEADSAKGNVLLFHGYKNNKSSMVARAEFFVSEGYNALLVDFAASGQSEGDQCTIGYKEAEQVKRAFDYVSSNSSLPVVLFGNSMGAAAIAKAMQDYAPEVESLILECPFGSMYETTCARFEVMGVPSFPMASVLVFWGGAINGFWAFDHNPRDYASSIEVPTLLIRGSEDKRVSQEETEAIYSALAGDKKLFLVPGAGHEDYLLEHGDAWRETVLQWLHK